MQEFVITSRLQKVFDTHPMFWCSTNEQSRNPIFPEKNAYYVHFQLTWENSIAILWSLSDIKMGI
jgi:hypothetical protein